MYIVIYICNSVITIYNNNYKYIYNLLYVIYSRIRKHAIQGCGLEFPGKRSTPSHPRKL